jgi:hypothetical protein
MRRGNPKKIRINIFKIAFVKKPNFLGLLRHFVPRNDSFGYLAIKVIYNLKINSFVLAQNLIYNKIMKKLLLILLTLISFLKFLSPCSAEDSRINYDLLYKDTPVLDFMYEDGIDQAQDSDYNRYVISPYTLIRITDTLRNKKILLQPGYYLVKPEKRDGYEFLLFKQNGKVAGVIPVYQKVLINPLLVYKEPIKPKTPLYKAIPKKIFIDTPKKIITWPFKKIFKQKTVLVPPKSALESKVVGDGKYLEIWLYVDTYLYKVLFKIEK